MSNHTPIAIILFNRPAHARSLRDALDSQQHRDLYVIVDGARDFKEGEQQLIDECISIFKGWNGNVKFNMAEKNLGCKTRITSGLDWVFEHVERAIILEDDLIPSLQFFQFCDEMLEAYAEEPKVMSVCGTKRFLGDISNNEYYFCKYHNGWGWATWRSAWLLYDEKFELHTTKQIFLNIRGYLGNTRAAIYWLFRLKQVQAGKKSAWDYCWNVTGFLHKGVHVFPSQNLVINTGFGEDSTHTNVIEPYMQTTYGSLLTFPVKVSKSIVSNNEADCWVEDFIFSKSFKNRFSWMLNKNNLFKLLKGGRI